jgi:hypothetical protein
MERRIIWTELEIVKKVCSDPYTTRLEWRKFVPTPTRPLHDPYTTPTWPAAMGEADLETPL